MKMPAKRRPTRMRCCVGKIIEYIQITTEDISSLVGVEFYRARENAFTLRRPLGSRDGVEEFLYHPE
jgi:hypothetical protein